MKLQNLLIGLGVFALFTIIIFSAIDTNNSKGIYSENYLNITHDSKTNKAIANISTIGKTTDDDYSSMKDDVRGTNATGFESGDLTEASFFKSAWRVLKSIPKAYKPISNVLRMSETQFGIPKEFTTWAMSAIIIIVSLMLITAFLRNKLQS